MSALFKGVIALLAQVILYPQLNSAFFPRAPWGRFMPFFGAYALLGSLLDAFICIYWRLATYLHPLHTLTHSSFIEEPRLQAPLKI